MEPHGRTGSCAFLISTAMIATVFMSERVWAKSQNVESVGLSPSVNFEATSATETSTEAPSPSQSKKTPDVDAAIAAAHTLGMPRLEAYLKRVKADSERKAAGEALEHPAPAPEPTDPSSVGTLGAPAPSSKGVEAKNKEPYFQGAPLARTESDRQLYTDMKAAKEKAEAEGKAPPVSFPVIFLDQLYNVDDLQADEIFSRGTAEIPSDIAKHNFAYCNQDTTLTMSWEKPTLWPRQELPEADQIFNDIARAFWHGSWFVTDPVTKERKLFNIALYDDTVAFIGGVDYVNPGYHPDLKPSFVVNYSSSEVTLLKPAYAEFRRVGPTIFLGSYLYYIDIHKWLAQYPQPWTQALLTAFGPLIDFSSGSHRDHKCNPCSPQCVEAERHPLPPEQFLPFSFYFAVDCQDYRIPPSHWLPVWTEGLTYFNNFWGWNPPNYELPSIPEEYSDPNWGNPSTAKFDAPTFKSSQSFTPYPPDPNDPGTGLKFNTSADRVDPFVLLPYTIPANATAGTPNRQGFVKLPAQALEPIFKNFWDTAPATAPVQANAPGADTKGAAQASTAKKEDDSP